MLTGMSNVPRYASLSNTSVQHGQARITFLRDKHQSVKLLPNPRGSILGGQIIYLWAVFQKNTDTQNSTYPGFQNIFFRNF